MLKNIKGGYLIFIILLIGLNHLRADEDITEAISDTTDAIATQPSTNSIDSTDESLRNQYSDESDDMKNPTIQRLPADSEIIRENIIDSEFNCDEKEPGYYADVENECQIFHRCLEGRHEVYSFICPKETRFDQRVLVCIWENDYNFDCTQSEQYYRESNRAFYGNQTAEENLNENIKNSQEIKNVAVVEYQTNSPTKEEIKLYEIIPTEELSIVNNNDEAQMIEKNSIEEIEKNLMEEQDENEKEVESVSQELDESNDYQAELIPTNHIDASIATSQISDSTSSLDVDSFETPAVPQKIISLSVLDPIIEMPNDDLTHESMTTIRNIRKRSGSHRKRFLFKADAH